jgi:hypothetical protein
MIVIDVLSLGSVIGLVKTISIERFDGFFFRHVFMRADSQLRGPISAW